jgi:hypothetical protein
VRSWHRLRVEAGEPGVAGSDGCRCGIATTWVGKCRLGGAPLRRRIPYTSIRFGEALALAKITPSVGSVGDAYDCEDVGYRQVA